MWGGSFLKDGGETKREGGYKKKGENVGSVGVDMGEHAKTHVCSKDEKKIWRAGHGSQGAREHTETHTLILDSRQKERWRAFEVRVEDVEV